MIGGLGRNRTTDTRIFKTKLSPSSSFTKLKKRKDFSLRPVLSDQLFRTRRRTPLNFNLQPT